MNVLYFSLIMFIIYYLAFLGDFLVLNYIYRIVVIHFLWSISCHQPAWNLFSLYADDIQLYIRINSTPSSVMPFSILTTCLEEIKAWIKQNILNSSKTEAILIGTPNQVRTSVINSITFSGQDFYFQHQSSTWVSKWTRIWPSRITSNIYVSPLFSTWWTSPNFALCSLLEMQKGLSTPLSPPGWTIVMHSSSGSLAKASRSCRTFRTVLLGSWCGCANMIIPLPSLNRSIGSLSHLGLSIRFPSSPTSVSMVTPPPPPTSRNFSLHVPSALCYGRPGFCSASPSLWNALPDHLRTPQSVDAFKCGLKTHLFSRAFAWFLLCSYIVALWDLFKYKVRHNHLCPHL